MTIAVTVNTLYLLLQIWASFCFIFDYIGRYSGYSAYRHEVSSKNTAVNSTVAWQDRFDRFDRWYYGRITYTHRKSILTRLSVYVSAIRLGQTAKSATSPDRKSTRLNSSHGYIPYSVFCLKKKKTRRTRTTTTPPHNAFW